MADEKIVSYSNISKYKYLSDLKLESIKSELENKIADARLPYELCPNGLPTASATCVGILYLTPSEDDGTNNIYQEYMCIEHTDTNPVTYTWEKFGTVAITEINKSGDKGSTQNAIEDISIEGNTITITYTTLATASDITNAIADALGTTITPAAIGAVPTSRTVNSKALSSDITLSASDVGALSAITKSGTKGTNDNVVSEVALNSDANGITVSYSQLTASGLGALTAISVSGTKGDNNAVTNIALNSASNGIDVTYGTIETGAKSLEDLGYTLADDADIEALFSDDN